MSNLVKLDPGRLAIFGDAAKQSKFSAGIKGGEYLPKISIKGKEFAFVIAGERKRTDKRTLDIVFIDAREAVSKEYYVKKWGQAGNDEAKAPDCASSDSTVPDSGVPAPQSPTCQTCPHNAWKSADNGKGKRCSDYKLVVVVPANKLDGQPFQLRIPAASLKALKSYERSLNTNGLPLNGVITQLSFADKEYPELEFAYMDALQTREDFETVCKTAERQDVQDALRAVTQSQPSTTHPSQQPVVIQPVPPTNPEPVQPTLPAQTETPAAVTDAGTQSEIDKIMAGWGVN
jgi:hypothetical protein